MMTNINSITMVLMGLIAISAAKKCYQCAYIPSAASEDLRQLLEMKHMVYNATASGNVTVTSQCADSPGDSLAVSCADLCATITYAKNDTVVTYRGCEKSSNACDISAAHETTEGVFKIKTSCCDADKCNGKKTGSGNETGGAAAVKATLIGFGLTVMISLLFAFKC